MAERSDSTPKSTWRFWRRLVLGLGALGAFCVLALLMLALSTPRLKVARATAAKLAPMPAQAATYLGFSHLSEASRLLRRPPWNDVVDPDLLRKTMARMTLPGAPGAGVAARLLSSFSGLLGDDGGVLGTDRGPVFIGHVGLRGRIAFNLSRWLAVVSPATRRELYGQTPGLSILARASRMPVYHLAMRGSYLFGAVNADELILALALADGSAGRSQRSLDSLLGPSIAGRPYHVLYATFTPDRPPRVWTAALAAEQLRLSYRYPLQEPMPTASPETLIATGRLLPKATGLFLATTWPPAIVASHSPTAAQLRDELSAWLGSRTGTALPALAANFGRPSAWGVMGWLDVPGHPPFPRFAGVAASKDGGAALLATDKLLRAVLKDSFARTEIGADQARGVTFRNESLGRLSPTVMARAGQVFVASTADDASDAVAAATGLTPCLADREEIGTLRQHAGLEPVAAVLLAPGPDLARLSSELLLPIAAKLSPTAAGDLRDLFVPTARRLARCRALVGRLIVEPDGRTGSWEGLLLASVKTEKK